MELSRVASGCVVPDRVEHLLRLDSLAFENAVENLVSVQDHLVLLSEKCLAADETIVSVLCKFLLVQKWTVEHLLVHAYTVIGGLWSHHFGSFCYDFGLLQSASEPTLNRLGHRGLLLATCR